MGREKTKIKYHLFSQVGQCIIYYCNVAVTLRNVVVLHMVVVVVEIKRNSFSHPFDTIAASAAFSQRVVF